MVSGFRYQFENIRFQVSCSRYQVALRKGSKIKIARRTIEQKGASPIKLLSYFMNLISHKHSIILHHDKIYCYVFISVGIHINHIISRMSNLEFFH